MQSSLIKTVATLGVATLVGACGGVAEQQASTPEGLFLGTDSLGRSQLLFVTSGGAYYSFYTTPNTTSLAGAIHGATLAFSGGTISTSSANDLNIVSKTSTTPNVTGTYTTAQNIALTYVYPDNSTITFNGTYNTGYQGIQSISTLAGTYKGTLGSLEGTDTNTTFTIAVDGSIIGSSASGCTYRGTAAPLYKGNGYTINLTTGPAPCAVVAQTANGLAYLDATSKTLYFDTSLTSNPGDGLVFKGVQQ